MKKRIRSNPFFQSWQIILKPSDIIICQAAF